MEGIKTTVREGFVSRNDDNTRLIHIPDMFASFMSAEPRENPHYDEIKASADAWIKEVLQLDEKQWQRFVKADFNHLVSLWAPDADKESLRVLMDWNNWIFFFDDQFDEGHLQYDVEAAQAECVFTFALLSSSHPTVSAVENPLGHIFQHTWLCFQKRASQDQQERYKKSTKIYLDSVVDHVRTASHSAELDLDEFLKHRRGSVGVFPAQDWIEWCYNINIPSYVFESNSLSELRRISTDATMLYGKPKSTHPEKLLTLNSANDILSYTKDLAEGCVHNAILILRKKGLSEQQAVDTLGVLFTQLYKDWYRAIAEMPIWGEHVDREVFKYIEVLQRVPIGNIYWSFRTGRYLQGKGETVRKTRIMAIPV